MNRTSCWIVLLSMGWGAAEWSSFQQEVVPVAAESEKARFAIVPDDVLDDLGEFDLGLAVDLHLIDLDRFGSYIPDALGCARDLLKTARMVVVTFADDSWEAHVTGLDEARTCECLGKLAPLLGFDLQHLDASYRLGLPENPLELAWHDDDAVIVQAGHAQRHGEPPVLIRDLLSQVPRSAKAWFVSSGFPQSTIDSVVLYIETTAETLSITATAESSEQGAAKSFVEGVLKGMKTSAAAKGVHIEDSWIVIDSTPTKAKVVATIPVAAIVPR